MTNSGEASKDNPGSRLHLSVQPSKLTVILMASTIRNRHGDEPLDVPSGLMIPGLREAVA